MINFKHIFEVKPEHWFERQWLTLAPVVLLGVVGPAIVMAMYLVRWPSDLDVHLALNRVAMYTILSTPAFLSLSIWGKIHLQRRARNIIRARLNAQPLYALAQLSEVPELKAWQRNLVIEHLVAHHTVGERT